MSFLFIIMISISISISSSFREKTFIGLKWRHCKFLHNHRDNKMWTTLGSQTKKPDHHRRSPARQKQTRKKIFDQHRSSFTKQNTPVAGYATHDCDADRDGGTQIEFEAKSKSHRRPLSENATERCQQLNFCSGSTLMNAFNWKYWKGEEKREQ